MKNEYRTSYQFKLPNTFQLIFTKLVKLRRVVPFFENKKAQKIFKEQIFSFFTIFLPNFASRQFRKDAVKVSEVGLTSGSHSPEEQASGL